MREAVTLTPLTPEEQTFAEENYEALVKAMRTHQEMVCPPGSSAVVLSDYCE